MNLFTKILLPVAIIFGSCSLSAQNVFDVKNDRLPLTKWELKSTVLEKTSGEDISKGNYSKEQWYSANVPTTVLNALVIDGVYPDPRLDMNNYQIPDISDKFNEEHDLNKYSYLPNHVNPWKDPYWFKTEFKIPGNLKGKQVWLNFDGINYRAEVWVNGKKFADQTEMAGMFQRFKFNITDAVKSEGINNIAVKIFQVDHPGKPGTQFKPLGPNRGPADDLFKDLTLKISGGWDCAMPVRDRNMGIYQDAYITFTDAVDIINPYIITKLLLPDTTKANVTVNATLFNASDKKQKGLLKGKISLLNNVDMCDYVKKLPGKMDEITFEKEVEVPANDTISVTLNNNDFAQLSIKNPYLWWPNGYGEQYLHNLELKFVIDGDVSAKKNTMFGIREVSSEMKEINGEFGRVFIINGKKIFNKGGWLQPDMLLDMNKQRVYDEARLLANANMNLVGTEDMPAPPQDWMDACDKYGLMWWEIFYQCWTTVPGSNSAYFPLDHFLAIQNERDIILRCRNSASLTSWIAENENVPGPDLYFALKEDLKKMDNSRVFIASTSVLWDWRKSTQYIKDDLPLGITDSGKPGYSWHPSPYFFDVINEVKGQMFRDELGIPSVPTLSSLKKFIFNVGANKENPLFPLDSVWAEHGAWDVNGYAYKSYDDAIRSTYGFKTKNIEDYVRTCQIINGEGYRAMFEAATARMWDITSGVMLWKLNSAAPDVVWSIYDWFLNPDAAYYFTKKACEPLHIQMNADNYQVSVVNATIKAIKNLKISAKVYDFDMKEKWAREEKINIGDNRYQEVFKVPQLSDITPVYFVKVVLTDESGKVLSSNFYWESSKTPTDFSDLAKITDVKLDFSYKTEEKDGQCLVRVTVKNPTTKLAYMNRLAIIKKVNNEEVLPTIWDDNFISLLPGEEQVVEARFAKKNLNGSEFSVVIDNNK
jgi:hypothetical protein